MASLWVMTAAGSPRCVLTEDWALNEESLASESSGMEAHLTAGGVNGGCTGVTAEPGDRLVLEVGVACPASSAGPLAATFARGGGGDPLTAGAGPGSGTCGLPGTLQLPPGLHLAGPVAPGPCEPESTPIAVHSRKFLSVQIGSGNQATAPALIEPDGTPRRYAYTYDAHGALDTKTELDADGEPLPDTTTDYEYDPRGNLRHVSLPDGTGGAVQAFYVYGDRANVPEYLIKTVPDPITGQPITTCYRLITHALGSVRLVVNVESGEIMQRVDYDKHGNISDKFVAKGWSLAQFGWAGGLCDPNLELLRFGARGLFSASRSLDSPRSDWIRWC